MSFSKAATHSNHVVALIVAAGYSKRFGSADKRTATLHQKKTLLATSYTSAALFFTHCRVIIRDHDDVSALGLAPDTPVYRAQHAAQGQGASMADGFRALLTEDSLTDSQNTVQAAAVWLGDIPYIAPATLAQLTCAANADNIIRPVWAGQVGHPVIFGRTFWHSLAELNGDKGAAKLIKQHPECYREIEVKDSGVCRDIDTPEDLQNINSNASTKEKKGQ